MKEIFPFAIGFVVTIEIVLNLLFNKSTTILSPVVAVSLFIVCTVSPFEFNIVTCPFSPSILLNSVLEIVNVLL